jgi:Recombination endonuclease VII
MEVVMKCGRCRLEKAPDEFNLARNTARGRQYWCRECARKAARERLWEWRQSLDPTLRARYDRSSNLMRLYGLTLDQYDALVAQQDGVCAICGEPPTKGRGKRLTVDHDHQTGEIRGLLCGLCNVGLGYLREDPKLLERAKAYLDRNSPGFT